MTGVQTCALPISITPFNFTAIAGNLPTAPALLGNVVVWKPSPTQQLAAHYTMRVLEAAGLPPGVINLVTGDGQAVSEVALPHRDLAGIHFTGSTATFQHLWRTVGENIAGYRACPRLVGETGGKDFVIAHPSADPAVLATALVRGAYEYQGQKCSAASRGYVPRSLWQGMRDDFLAQVESLTVGDVGSDLSLFMGAVIARDRAAIAAATDVMRFAAGNFYINDKPTGAVVGQQPFGGARASGTNDKAGSIFNLTRWVNARTIKETFVPPTDYRYPHMG